jgi:hypothetical protein
MTREAFERLCFGDYVLTWRERLIGTLSRPSRRWGAP